MLVERLTFRAKYGQGDTLVALFKESVTRFPTVLGAHSRRIYTDATGPMFTVQVEQEFTGWDDYAAFMTADQELYGTPDFQDWFARMTACTESGDRQLLNVETV